MTSAATHSHAALIEARDNPPRNIPSKERPQLGRENLRSGRDTFFDFQRKVKGVMPGYTGHRPGARDVFHVSTFGGVKPFLDGPGQIGGRSRDQFIHSERPTGQGQTTNRPTTYHSDMNLGNLGIGADVGRVYKEKPATMATPTHRADVGGVKPGYTGFVPGNKQVVGTSHWLATDSARAGHEAEIFQGDKHKAVDVSGRTQLSRSQLPGYLGHVPRAREAFGASARKAGLEVRAARAHPYGEPTPSQGGGPPVPRHELNQGRGSPRSPEWSSAREIASAPSLRRDLGEPQFARATHQGYYPQRGAGRESASYPSKQALGGSIAGRSVNPEELYAC